METQSDDKKYFFNPDYGKGVFRRSIRLTGSEGKVQAELEDCAHGFRSTVYHDGKTVTNVEIEALRVPLNTCGGAAEPLKQLIGVDVNATAVQINQILNPKANCTHLLDLSILAIAHIKRGNSVRQYDVAVPDASNSPQLSTVVCDGKQVLQWLIGQGQVVEPTDLVGKPLLKGFANWAGKYFSGDEQEAAFVLQKGYFVALSRRYDSSKTKGFAVVHYAEMQGACYSYSTGVVEHALSTGTNSRDFTDCPEQLLRFS